MLISVATQTTSASYERLIFGCSRYSVWSTSFNQQIRGKTNLVKREDQRLTRAIVSSVLQPSTDSRKMRSSRATTTPTLAISVTMHSSLSSPSLHGYSSSCDIDKFCPSLLPAGVSQSLVVLLVPAAMPASWPHVSSLARLKQRSYLCSP